MGDDYKSADRYLKAQLEGYMCLNSAQWFCFQLGAAGLLFMTPHLFPVLVVNIVLSLYAVVLFSHNVVNAAKYGFVVAGMLPWLVLPRHRRGDVDRQTPGLSVRHRRASAANGSNLARSAAPSRAARRVARRATRGETLVPLPRAARARPAGCAAARAPTPCCPTERPRRGSSSTTLSAALERGATAAANGGAAPAALPLSELSARRRTRSRARRVLRASAPRGAPETAATTAPSRSPAASACRARRCRWRLRLGTPPPRLRQRVAERVAEDVRVAHAAVAARAAHPRGKPPGSSAPRPGRYASAQSQRSARAWSASAATQPAAASPPLSKRARRTNYARRRASAAVRARATAPLSDRRRLSAPSRRSRVPPPGAYKTGRTAGRACTGAARTPTLHTHAARRRPPAPSSESGRDRRRQRLLRAARVRPPRCRELPVLVDQLRSHAVRGRVEGRHVCSRDRYTHLRARRRRQGVRGRHRRAPAKRLLRPRAQERESSRSRRQTVVVRARAVTYLIPRRAASRPPRPPPSSPPSCAAENTAAASRPICATSSAARRWCGCAR